MRHFRTEIRPSTKHSSQMKYALRVKWLVLKLREVNIQNLLCKALWKREMI